MDIKTRIKRDCFHQAIRSLGDAIYRSDEDKEIYEIYELIRQIRVLIFDVDSKNNNNVLL